MTGPKTCPFCGSSHRKLMGYDYHKIGCSNVDCKIYKVAFFPEEWNTRANGWVSVDDSLPDFGEEVLILLEVGGNIERGTHRGNGDFNGNWCERRGENYCYKVTNWMPLPEMP